MVAPLVLVTMAAGLAMAVPFKERDIEKRQLGLPALPIVGGLLNPAPAAPAATSGFISVVQLAPNVFTSFRVITQEFVYTVPGAATVSSAAGAAAPAPTPAPVPAVPTAAPAADSGLLGLGGLLGGVVSAVTNAVPLDLEATVAVSAPILDVAATVCLGILVNGVCQETTVQPAPGATQAGDNGLLGLPITLPGIEIQATVAATVAPSDLGVPLPPIDVNAGLCLGIFTNGVCYTSDPAAVPQPTAASPLGLPGIELSASLCIGIFRDGLCFSALNAATSTLVNILVTTDPAAVAALPTEVLASVTAIASPAVAAVTGAAAVTSIIPNAGGVFTSTSLITIPFEETVQGLSTIFGANGAVSQVLDAAGSVVSVATGVTGDAGSVVSAATGAAGSILPQVTSAAGSVISGATGAVGSILPQVTSAAGSVVSGATGAAGNLVSGALSGVESIATGALGGAGAATQSATTSGSLSSFDPALAISTSAGAVATSGTSLQSGFAATPGSAIPSVFAGLSSATGSSSGSAGGASATGTASGSGTSGSATGASAGGLATGTASSFDPALSASNSAGGSSAFSVGGSGASAFFSGGSGSSFSTSVISSAAFTSAGSAFQSVSSSGSFVSISSNGASNANSGSSGQGSSSSGSTGQTGSQAGSGAQVTGASSAVGGAASASPASTFGTFVFDPLSPSQTSSVVVAPGSGGVAVPSTRLSTNGTSGLPLGVLPFTGEATTTSSRDNSLPAMVVGIVAAMIMF